MHQSRAEAEPTSARVALRIGASFEAALTNVVLPWIESVSGAALRNQEPVAVVTPLASYGTFIRAELLRRKISLLAVKFLTPAQLRELLLGGTNTRVPLREHLRLLLSIAAEECMQLPPDREARDRRLAEPDYLAAKAVARAPDHFLRSIDQLSAAGWDLAEEGPAVLREVTTKFLRHVRECGFELIYNADRIVLNEVSSDSPRFCDLLVVGFNSTHWPFWPLLHAAAVSSKRATIVLDYPRDQARAVDESWVGTWEEIFGAAVPIDESDKENPRDAASPNQPHFLVGVNATEQASAIAAMAMKFLADESCTRLGIVFPRTGALSRLVSNSLTKFGIPHHDGPGHFTPGDFEEPAWNAWLELQENRQLDALLRFLNALPANSDFFGELSIQATEEILRKVYREILIDDILLLRERCLRQGERPHLAQVAEGLEKLKFLPPKASFARFLADTKSIFAQLKWKEHWAQVQRLSHDWADSFRPEFRRAIYLRWLREILDSFSLRRDPEGDHPYSRVHLLSYAEAEGQEWSHLILAGLNQGEWPRSESESGFLSEQEIVDLNKRALRQGKQGEGHLSLREDKTVLLGPQEQRQIAVRQFTGAVESPSVALAVTANLLHETAPERIWNPSEFFSQLYFSARGSVLSQATMSILREQTRAWLDKQKFLARDKVEKSDAGQTRVAYDARRTNEMAGEYEFALRQPPAQPITLRATEWDKIVKHPALIWMKIFLGVENNQNNFSEWSAATGTWVHRWLAQISIAPGRNVFVDFPRSGEARERVRQCARRFRDEIVDLCFSCGRTLPDWWLSGWSNALALADCLGLKVSQLEDGSQMAAEWNLESPQIVSLNPSDRLRFRGRIDLILARDEKNNSELGRADIWIVDYKTGGNKGLRAATWKTPEARFAGVRKKLVRGDAVQLGLYALAARELGAEKIALSLLSPRLDLERPQLDLVDLAAHSDFWSELYRMQETGIFGLLGPIRSEFSFAAAYPLATLPIDEEFLREKWNLTHPALADDEDDRS